MKTRWLRRAAFAASALVVTACCGRGCGLREGEQSFEKWDGSIKASLVRKTTWKGGGTKVPIWLPSSRFAIRVETTPPFEEPTDCEKVVFADDGKGKALAFRCHDQTSWTVLRLRGGDRRVTECDAPIGGGKKPDFTKLEPLSVAAPRILACERYPDPYATEQLTQAILEDEGEAAVLGFADLLSRRPFHGSGIDSWHDALSLLVPSVREKALARVCAVLAPGEAVRDRPRFLRAIARCGLSDPRTGDGALVMLKQVLGDPAANEERPVEPNEELTQTVRWASALALRHRPAEAGALACAALPEHPDPRLLDAVYTPLVTVIARSNTRCETLPRLLRWAPCGPDVTCGKDLCDAAKLAEDTKDWSTFDLREQPFVAKGRLPLATTHVERALLFAFRIQGPLPREITLRHARRQYPVAKAPVGTPACDETLAANTPCVCPEELAGHWSICQVGPDDAAGSFARCGYRVDDKNKRIADVRLVCKTEGSACGYGANYCCKGLTCAADGAGSSACFASPPAVPAGSSSAAAAPLPPASR